MADTETPAADLPADTPAPEVKDGATEPPARDPNKVYTQEEVDAIAKKIKSNTRLKTKNETKAYYEGMMAGKTQAAPPVVEAPPAEEKPPTRDQFGSYEEFLEAKTEFTAKRTSREDRAAAERETQAKAAQEAATTRAETFKGKLLEKYPDVVERAESIGHVVLPDHIYDAIHESEIGPDLFNSFVDAPKELERIMALSPSAALREIGGLERDLKRAAAEKAEPTETPGKPAVPASRAPPPLRTVGGTSPKTGDDLASLVNQPDRWLKARQAQLAKKRAGG